MSKPAPSPSRSRNGRTGSTTRAAVKNRPKHLHSSAHQVSASPSQETSSQFTLKMRKSLHRELARMAFDSNMTMRGFIMNALKGKGLSVTKADLVDRRRR